MTTQIETPKLRRLRPSPSHSVTISVRVPERGGEFAEVARVIAEADAVLGAIEVVGGDSEHCAAIVAAIGELDGVRVDDVCDRTFVFHEGGTLEVNAKRPLST